jgi:hypothetical protein
MIEQGAEELVVTLTKHIETVLKAMQGDPILRRIAKWEPKAYLRS